MRKIIFLQAAISILFITNLADATVELKPIDGLTLTYDGGLWIDANTVVLGVNEVLALSIELDEGYGTVGGAVDYILSNSAAEFITEGGYGYDPVEFLCSFCLIQSVQVHSAQYVTLEFSNDLCGPIYGPCIIMQNLLVHSLDAKNVELNIITQGVELDGKWIPAGIILHTVQILPKIELLAPNGGENLTAGSTYPISWNSIPEINEVLVEYSTNNGQDWTEVDPPNSGNTGSYDWEPVPTVDSNKCLVRVSDANDPNVYDVSDGLFTIFECQVPIIGDLNKDCYVDFRDMAIFSMHWLECGNPFDPDCNP